MNYYFHHVGDYRADTGHLSLLEHGVYRQLLDLYYLSEKPIPLETEWVLRRLSARTEADQLAIQSVLKDFFVRGVKGYTHKRCDMEIREYVAKADTARANGKLGGRPKKTQPVISGNPEITTSQANQEPITKNQEPLNTLPPDGGCPVEPDCAAQPLRKKPVNTLPDCPYGQLRDLWQTRLPHLTQPRVWEGNRKATMRNRWHQAAKPSTYSPNGYATEPEGIAWWDGFFGYIANDTRLANGFDSNGRTWKPDLEWVCNAANFQKIIDGKYAK